MKYILFIALILSVVSCTEHDGYTLTGHVPEAWEGKPVFLALDDTNQPHFIDSTKISGGKFRFLGKFDVPRYCTVSIYLDPNDRLTRSKILVIYRQCSDRSHLRLFQQISRVSDLRKRDSN